MGGGEITNCTAQIMKYIGSILLRPVPLLSRPVGYRILTVQYNQLSRQVGARLLMIQEITTAGKNLSVVSDETHAAVTRSSQTQQIEHSYQDRVGAGSCMI